MAITLIRCFVLMVVSNIVIGNNVVIASAEKHVVSNVKSKWIHVLPRGPVPPTGPSHGCTPPCGHKNVVSNIQSKGFHVLPKGPVPPSGPSPPCSHPPCGGRGGQRCCIN
ncbi:hypothetical protein LR48_Vigan02g050300 [Vigna angularis]|uniref:Uncharacterized protein n=2 Tax=Phaseolus angularis TaxID=3914 RepID=A0A0L9TUT9_PHAAN|nr:uncharacterized protein HKW66_Vig0185680 [Vigna angularis]KOM34353.1 hypothetical protein LR48_Vigan02g050300 [Vigna angularis]